jgi:hypothetical protein
MALVAIGRAWSRLRMLQVQGVAMGLVLGIIQHVWVIVRNER